MRLLLLVLVGLLLGALPARAGFDEAMAAYFAGDYAFARTELERLVQDGDLRATSALAVMHARGEGVEKDMAEAARLFGVAAEGGSSDAQFNLGRIVYAGAVGERDPVRAAALFRQAAGQGHVLASLVLANQLYRGDGVAQDLDGAAALAGYAARTGQPQAMQLYGLMHERGEGVAQDAEKAYFWVYMATELGLASAGDDLGRISAGLDEDTVLALRRRARDWQPEAPRQP